MTSGILVGARGRITVGILLDTSDEQPRFRVVLNDFAAEVCKEAVIEAGAANELLAWLSQALREPRAI